ncbi:unnamed protein product [Acanthosepion pharaonis]|uniref:Uncharacterized protein n=1 Tax=Acanthosepion pharaonis TaxID=158019 RepID=A0A812CWQ8_ACAPH|nr:unnamed protein product [Sepia pharaonis]
MLLSDWLTVNTSKLFLFPRLTQFSIFILRFVEFKLAFSSSLSAPPVEAVFCLTTFRDYLKYIRKLQKLTESEEAKERREARRFMGIRLRNKIMTQKYGGTTKDARVKPYPQAEKKIETKNSEAGVSHCSEKPTHSKTFPIYSQGIVCGYFCTNENEMPPQKIALTNLRSATTLSPPNNFVQPPLIKLAQGTQVPRRTMEPVSASGNNSSCPSTTVNTLSMTTMEKTINGHQPLEPLNMCQSQLHAHRRYCYGD